MKHKNQIIADDNFKNHNCEYTVFRRTGDEYRMIKNLEEYHSAIFDLTSDKSRDKVRIALFSDGHKFYVMNYKQDGTHFVVGYVYRGKLC